MVVLRRHVRRCGLLLWKGAGPKEVFLEGDPGESITV